LNTYDVTKYIKRKALDLGFSGCGISKAEFLAEEADRLETWLKNGYHASMQYMENHFDKRLDPRLLVPGAKSVISVLLNYWPGQIQFNTSCKISKYAYGKDYHLVMKEKLKTLFEYIRSVTGDVQGRCFVDSAPVLERAWAAKSGLGWIGKNSLLLTKQSSWFFLGEIITKLELDYDKPIKEYCGKCTRCLDACPTGAIIAPGIVDASRCISYLTIENKEEIPENFRDKMNHWIFGCDICQDVCPWTVNANRHNEKKFIPNSGLTEMNDQDWNNLSQERFRTIFRKSAVKRTKYHGLIRNIKFINHHGVQNKS
jgi:epoxyqueuosine reductase